MSFAFPKLPKLSLWDIACGHTGQNAVDTEPTNETRYKLAELVRDVAANRLAVEFVRPGDDSGLFLIFMPNAPRAAADADWRKLNDVTVRREDWERYQQAPVAPNERNQDKHVGTAKPNPVSQDSRPRTVDFLSIAEALSFIANTLNAPPGRTTDEDEPMWRASEAAAVLHEHLNNASEGRPRWFEVNETTGKPLVKDAVANEGMSILLHAAGWYDRETSTRTRHTLDCVRAGLDPAIVGPASRDPNAGQWDYIRYFLREYRIGFARSELANLLGMTFGAVTANDKDEAREILAQTYARLDQIAWAMVILAPNAPAQGEARYRQIQDVTNWLVSVGLQFRSSGGLPASLPAGTPVTDTDVREYQYLAVADVRTAAISARCWPKNADQHGNIEGASPWGNTATQSVELPLGKIPASVLAYRIAMAFVDVPYGTSAEAWVARSRFEAVVSKHLDQMTDMARQRSLMLVAPDGTETNDISVGCLSHRDAKAYLEKYHIIWSESAQQPAASQKEVGEKTSPAKVDDRLEEMAEFVRTHVEEDLRVQRVVEEFPEFLEDVDMVNRAIAIGTARAQQSKRADTQRSSDGPPSSSNPVTELPHSALKISKAPPPIEPLTRGSHSRNPDHYKAKPESSISGYGRSSRSHLERKLMPKSRPPRWSKWRLMPEVRVWEAVALSLDIEPDQVETDSNAWMGAEHPFAEGQEFNDRLIVTLANLSNRDRFPTACAINMGKPYLHGIRLSEFARFAIEAAQWEMPNELRVLSGNSVASPSVAVPNAVHAPTSAGIIEVVTEASNAAATASLRMGTNNKEAMDAYINTRARAMYAGNPRLTKGNIAKAIAEEFKNAGYSGERGDYLSAATIEKAIPAGLTGGRAANGRNRKK
ncbi:hypothetical protein [Burkholderia pseudomallei]|uniref:hypothetical protein n=1 Tax=Burkholderia pseudomallei TaxID=28450 RepID=UPI00100BF11E|nr:hypothetical protein [Burkholderia pseudomallei]